MAVSSSPHLFSLKLFIMLSITERMLDEMLVLTWLCVIVMLPDIFLPVATFTISSASWFFVLSPHFSYHFFPAAFAFQTLRSAGLFVAEDLFVSSMQNNLCMKPLTL